MCRLKAATLTLTFLVSVLVGSVAFAQRRSGANTTVPKEIQVRVSLTDERHIGAQIEVDLLNEQSATVAQAFTDNEGRATFQVSGGGIYRARASGSSIETTVSDAINVQTTDRTAMIWMHVQLKAGGEADNAGSSGITTANDLKVPSDARKLFTKGSEALQHHDYQKAADLFQKAITTYPQYDAAYDNLGVAYMQLKQTDKARAAFEHAVQLNDKNADADRNYGRLLLANKEYPQAVDVLKKSLMVDPQNPSALLMVSIAQFQTHDFDGALQSALKVHQGPHEGYALAHFVAGRSYEVKHEYAQATAEYETYVKEDPKGSQVEQARSALAHMTASSSGATTTPSGASPQ
jgi:Flp pilus assembly protein TadD